MLGLPGFVTLVAAWCLVYGLVRWLHVRGTLRRDLHRDVVAVGVLVLATIGFYWQLFFTESWIPKGGGDLASFIYPIYAFGARWLKRGVIPLWNPHLYLGMPFAADNQSGLFYPVNLLFFLLTPELTYEVVELMAVTHVFLAGLFAYLFLRDLPSPRLAHRAQHGTRGPHGTWGTGHATRDTQPATGNSNLSRPAALAGAVTFMFSDLYVVHPGNLNIIATAAWLPLALLCFRRALARQAGDRRGWAWAGWSGVVLAVAATVGHAQLFLYVAMTLGLYDLYQVYLHRREGWRPMLARLGKLLLVGGIAFGLAALALIPAYDLTRYTVRAEMDYARSSDLAIPPAGLVSILLPGFFGRGTGPFWGPWVGTEMGYTGVMPLLLAVIAIVLTIRRCPTTRFWLLLAAFGLLTALGGNAVLHGWTYALIPFFRQLRVPARAIVLLDFAVAMLAAVGLDLLLRPLLPRARRALASITRVFQWGGAVLALVGLPLLGYAVLRARALSRDVLEQSVASMGSLVFFLLMLGASLGWLILRRYRLASRTALAVLAVCLIVFDLTSQGAYVEVEPNDPLVGYRHDRVLEYLRADPDIYRVETPAEVQGGWAPDWALIHEMDDLGGIWNPLRLGAYDVLTWVGIERESRFYDMYNVKYLIAGEDTVVPPHFEPVYQDGKRTLYRNPRALPRAFMVYRAEVVGGDIRALSAARAPEFDPALQVVLKKGAEPLDAEPGVGERRVEIVDRGPNHMDLAVVTPVDGYLFVSEMWMPDWVVYVDGKSQGEVLKANYTFRAVRVPAGSHEVHMVYRPRPWRIGLTVTLVTLAALLAWAAWSLADAASDMARLRSTLPSKPAQSSQT
jgi:hypothetical protein